MVSIASSALGAVPAAVGVEMLAIGKRVLNKERCVCEIV